jgi:mannose-6-phosphate isomerase
MSMPETTRTSRTTRPQPTGIGPSERHPNLTGPHFSLTPATMHPLRFDPIIKRLIWGGNRLGSVLGKSIGEGSQYAESWELSDHRTDVSVVAEGPLAGMSLRDLVRYRTEELLGSPFSHLRQFPLLVKYIDAEQVLSVQVHPDDERGHLLADDNGKTETWVVIDAKPGSVIYAGLKPGVTRERFAQAIEAGEVEPLLHKIPARAGDCILIPAGIVHAIGAGVMLAEIQQMSDATFRVFDWNRIGADGNPRPLHVAQALESTDFEAGPVHPLATQPVPVAGGSREALSHTEFFSLERLNLTGRGSIGCADRFTIVMAIDGDVDIHSDGESTRLRRGETLLLPASLGVCEVEPIEGPATLITCIVP